MFGRNRELLKLQEWCVQSRQNVCLVTGAAGTGKTRIAQELGLRMSDRGWTCGWLRQEWEVQRAVDTLCGGDSPTLVLVDDAETKSPLSELIGHFYDYSGDAPLRLLLLCRAQGDHWSLPDHYRSATEKALVNLDESSWTKDDRQRWYERAVQALAFSMHTPSPPHLKLHDDDPSSPFLHLMSAALLTVLEQDGRKAPTAHSAVSNVLIAHEENHYWRPSAQAFGLASILHGERSGRESGVLIPASR